MFAKEGSTFVPILWYIYRAPNCFYYVIGQTFRVKDNMILTVEKIYLTHLPLIPVIAYKRSNIIMCFIAKRYIEIFQDYKVQ